MNANFGKGWSVPVQIKLIIFILSIILSVGCREQKTGFRNPNVIIILADDLGYGDLECYGATKIETPVIDKLASEGMMFTNAYVTSSLCSPSRYSILTGRYSWRTRLKFGVLKYFEKPLIENDRTTLATMLKRNGYHTTCVGKWHLGLDWQVNDRAPENVDDSVFNTWNVHAQEYIDFTKPVRNGPLEHGFDYFYGMAGSNNMEPYVFIENDHVTQAPSVEQKPYDHYGNVPRAPNWDIKEINQDLTHKAVEVINDHFQNHKEQPLFFYFAASAIHRPCLPTFTRGKSQAGLRGDIVVELDWTVVQVIKALKANNAYDNTLLIFTSDNGPRPGDPAYWLDRYENGDYDNYHQAYFDDYVPEYVNPDGNLIWKNGWFTYGHSASGPLLGFKSDAWEGGLRVPFIVHWPQNVEAGTVNNRVICLSDLMATFAELVGDSLGENEGDDSYSFLPNLFNENAPQVRKSLTLTSGASGAFIEVQNGWKYIEAATPGRWPETYYPDGPSKLDPQLYNLNEDVSEQHNLYENIPDKVKELKDMIRQIQATPGIEGR